MKYPFLLLLFIASQSTGQLYKVKKRPTLFVNSASFDFKTPMGGSFRSLKDNYSGFGISYWQGLGNHFDLSLAGNFSKVFYPFKTGLNYRTRSNLSEGDIALNIKPLNDNHVVVPYLTAGIGFYVFSSTNGSYAPLGAGLQFNIKHKVFILTSFQYRAAVTSEAASHLFYGLHVGVPLTKRRPSSSTSSISSVQTPYNYDRDNDGVPDSIDNCPRTPGLARYKGCPVPLDTDNDGVEDAEDRCPTRPGPASNGGCPVVDKPAPTAPPVNNNLPPAKDTTNRQDGQEGPNRQSQSFDIFFYSGITTLPEASKRILETVAEAMKNSPDANVLVTGYTDDLEFEDAAKANSLKRAESVAASLRKMGIAKSRITTAGAGAASPKASNETVVGRSQNRRVEVKVF